MVEMAEKHMMRSHTELESYEGEGIARLAALEPNAAYIPCYVPTV